MNLFKHVRVILTQSSSSLHTTSILGTFFVKDAKGGYKDTRKRPSTIQFIRDGFKELKGEMALWRDEVSEHFKNDPLLVYNPGETDIFCRFNKENIDNWIVTADSDHSEGYSKCSLHLNENAHAVFAGELSTAVPKDGKVKRAGYCSLTSLPARKSFKRETYYNWICYNTLVMRIRGDGRSYIINLASKGYYDLLWNDVYHYVLFTRGGPYWQIAKIPFSKFFLSSRGRVQDRQNPVPLDRITSFGLAMGDKINGPFNLEIDYIGLEFDPNHKEEFAYEMYKTDKHIVAT